MIAWPDWCFGLLMACSAPRSLDRILMVRSRGGGTSRRRPSDIAVRLAMYGFCSVLGPSVIENGIHSPLYMLQPVSLITPPNPTTSFRVDELVAMQRPFVGVAMAIVLISSVLIVACSRGQRCSQSRQGALNLKFWPLR
jgi:hypothetical protein